MYCNYEFNDTLNGEDNKGYFYLFSDLKKIKKEGLVTALPRRKTNKIITDDMSLRYIHRLTFEKPFKLLKKKSPLATVPFDTKLIEDVYNHSGTKKYASGYIIPYRYGYRYLLNMADVLQDVIVFDYLSLDQDKLAEDIATVTLDDREMEILARYMSGYSMYESSKEILDYFSKSPLRRKDQGPVTLYRGLNFYHKAEYEDFVKACQVPDSLIGRLDMVSSWTTNICVATAFANKLHEDSVYSETDNNSIYGVVLMNTFQPSDILVDTRLIDSEQLQELFPAIQREVIIKPGNYRCNIIMRMEDNVALDPEGIPVSYVTLS